MTSKGFFVEVIKSCYHVVKCYYEFNIVLQLFTKRQHFRQFTTIFFLYKSVFYTFEDKLDKPFTTQSRHLTTLRRRLRKRLWEKEKMLVSSIFSFSHSVFTLFLKGIILTINPFFFHHIILTLRKKPF